MTPVEREQPPTEAERSLSETPADLAAIYSNRFSGMEKYRNEVWKLLTRAYFSRWIKPSDAVLDLGCGYGEFINNIAAARKFGMDLNPTSRSRVAANVTLFEQDCSARWPLPDNTLDIVFTSNFFEHLPTKASLQETLAEVFRCLKPGGRILALGPNIKYLSGPYWDFFDHHIALTELSLAEGMQMAGFSIEKNIARCPRVSSRRYSYLSSTCSCRSSGLLSDASFW